MSIMAAISQAVGAKGCLTSAARESRAARKVLECLPAVLRRAFEREYVVQDLHPQHCGLPLFHVGDGLDALELSRKPLPLSLDRCGQGLFEDGGVAELHQGGKDRLLLPGASVVGNLVHVEHGGALRVGAAQVAVSIHLRKQQQECINAGKTV